MVALDPRRLLVLAAVSDRGGVVAAANAMHLTPSAVSQQLVRLEREAGVALIDRSHRQARLTVAGEQLADRGRKIGYELQAAEADVSEWFGASGTTVVVAAFATAIKRLLAPIIPQLDAGHDMAVSIVEREGRHAITALHAGDVDVALLEVAGDNTPLVGPGTQTDRGDRPSLARLRTVMRVSDEYRIVVPADWAVDDWLADRTVVEELVRRPWIVAAHGTAGRAALSGLTASWQFSPRVGHECSELTSLVALVGAGFGAGIMPHLAWADVTDRTVLLDNDRIREATGVQVGMGVRHIAVVVRDTPRRVPAIELFLAALQRAADGEQLSIEPAS